MKNNQTEEQRKNLEGALKLGALRDLALSIGGTGELRKPLTTKEANKRKKRRQMAKASRKANRK